MYNAHIHICNTLTHTLIYNTTEQRTLLSLIHHKACSRIHNPKQVKQVQQWKHMQQDTDAAIEPNAEMHADAAMKHTQQWIQEQQ